MAEETINQNTQDKEELTKEELIILYKNFETATVSVANAAKAAEILAKLKRIIDSK